MVRRSGVIGLIVMVYAAAGAAQVPVQSEAAALGRAWSAIGRGRTAEAVAAADEALKIKPRSHDAIAVRIAALSPSQPLAALDGYEAWVSRTATEDVFLLDPIARGVLSQIAAGTDTGLKLLALERLARAGSDDARARLQELSRSAPTAFGALATLGDTAAANSLIQAAADGTLRPETAAELLPSAGPAAVPALLELLKNPAPPVRAEAIRGLARLGATTAVPQLRAALADPHPLVSGSAAVSLTRLGDSAGEERVNQMLASDVPDVRLMAAAAFAARGQGPWIASITPLLQDPNGLTRFTAAELIAPFDPQAARSVLAAALSDQNPVVRAEASRVLATPALAAAAKTDIAALRRLLRDPDPAVKLHGAALILELASGS